MTEQQTPFLHPIAKDPRPILTLTIPTSGQYVAFIGDGQTTEIRAYLEDDGVPWFAVYSGDFLFARVAAAHVLVTYASPTPDPQP